MAAHAVFKYGTGSRGSYIHYRYSNYIRFRYMCACVGSTGCRMTALWSAMTAQQSSHHSVVVITAESVARLVFGLFFTLMSKNFRIRSDRNESTRAGSTVLTRRIMKTLNEQVKCHTGRRQCCIWIRSRDL